MRQERTLVKSKRLSRTVLRFSSRLRDCYAKAKRSTGWVIDWRTIPITLTDLDGIVHFKAAILARIPATTSRKARLVEISHAALDHTAQPHHVKETKTPSFST